MRPDPFSISGVFLATIFILLAGGCKAISPQPVWELTWSDEFHGLNGSPADPANWSFEIGDGGWGNNELEYCTDRAQNAYLQDDMLVKGEMI
jgi:hypothetical protein